MSRLRVGAALLCAGFLGGCLAAPPDTAASGRPAPAVPDVVHASPASGVQGIVPADDTVVRAARRMVVRVRARTCRGVETGSGFAVSEHLVVTNRHVVEQAFRVETNTWDGRTATATVSAVDLAEDLALVLVGGALEAHGELAAEDPPVGLDVTVVGHPLGGLLQTRPGTVVDYARLDRADGPRVVRIDAPVERGNSGGPVLDARGRVVAVVFAFEEESGRALAVPVTGLRELLATGGSPRPPLAC